MGRWQRWCSCRTGRWICRRSTWPCWQWRGLRCWSWGRVHSLRCGVRFRRRGWCSVLRWRRTRIVHPGDHLQICWVWWGFRCREAEERFYLHLHELLPSESAVAHSSALLAAVWHVDISAVQLRCRLRSRYRIAVVPSAEGLLLCNSGSWLRDSPTHSNARACADSPTYTATPTATHVSANDSATRAHGATRTC